MLSAAGPVTSGYLSGPGASGTGRTGLARSLSSRGAQGRVGGSGEGPGVRDSVRGLTLTRRAVLSLLHLLFLKMLASGYPGNSLIYLFIVANHRSSR